MARAFSFRCPARGLKVEVFAPLKSAEATPRRRGYEIVSCLTCRDIHVVDRTTGRLPFDLAGDDYEPDHLSLN
jgi:hypothetical protein